MKLIKNGVDISNAKMIYNNQQLAKIYYRNDVIYSQNAVPYYPRATLNIATIGDSTIAAGYGGNLVPSYVSEFTPITSVATAGDTIQGQRAKFTALTSHTEYDVVIMQIGLNDMSPATQTTQTVLTNYQAFVDYIRSVVKTNCKIYVSQMLPCKQRYINYYGAEDGALAYQRWLDLNNAIANTITNVDGRITSHVTALNDGNDNLAAQYDTGDAIHENPAGRQVIANAWRDKLIADQVFST